MKLTLNLTFRAGVNYYYYYKRNLTGFKLSVSVIAYRVVNPRLDKSGRAGPVRPENLSGLGRAVQAQNFCGPGRAVFCEYSAKILPISAIFLNEQYLILNELLIKFKFSLKNLLKILIEIKLSMTGPRFQPGPAQRFTTLIR